MKMPKENIPYSPEWEKEMMRMSKKKLVVLLRTVCQDNEILFKNAKETRKKKAASPAQILAEL